MRDEALFCYLFYLSKENATMKIIYKDGHVDECPQDLEPLWDFWELVVRQQVQL